jgi:hypothetical protein
MRAIPHVRSCASNGILAIRGSGLDLETDASERLYISVGFSPGLPHWSNIGPCAQRTDSRLRGGAIGTQRHRSAFTAASLLCSPGPILCRERRRRIAQQSAQKRRLFDCALVVRFIYLPLLVDDCAGNTVPRIHGWPLMALHGVSWHCNSVGSWSRGGPTRPNPSRG